MRRPISFERNVGPGDGLTGGTQDLQGAEDLAKNAISQLSLAQNFCTHTLTLSEKQTVLDKLLFGKGWRSAQI